MKKVIAVILALVLCVTLFSACSNTDGGDKELASSKAQITETEAQENTLKKVDGKISIVTTVFPIYDWVKNIIGDDANAEVSFLLNNGADLHNYQPTADDMIKIADCDMFIYIGGESDEWVEDALANAVNKDMVVINLMDVLASSLKVEEIKEGMQAEEEEEEDENEPEYDEHIWLSVKNASVCVEEIADKLAAIGAEGNPYLTNAASYNDKLSALDHLYELTTSTSEIKILLFGDRFPFRYLVEDYDLEYYAAFAGCSAETEASFKTISYLSSKVDEFGLKYVLTLESSDGKIANTIIQSSHNNNAEILKLNSMQSTTLEDAEKGASYIEIMNSNLKVLEKALN